jgi:transposase
MIVAKFADHLPSHRQAKIFSRFGVELNDQTMCGWMRQCAELLNPLSEAEGLCAGFEGGRD